MSALMAFVLRGLHSLEWRGAVASWLVCSSTERAVQVQALTIGDNVLCSWARQFTLTVHLSTQEYLMGASKLLGKTTNCGGVTYIVQRTSIPSRGRRNTPSRFMLQKPG